MRNDSIHHTVATDGSRIENSLGMRGLDSQPRIRSAANNCAYGIVARVVYSRFFPEWTKPQTGRLNKSPHTVYAFANRY
jgi:hypothetical protein